MKEENNVRSSNSWARNKAIHRPKTGEHATANQLGTIDFKSGKEIKFYTGSLRLSNLVMIDISYGLQKSLRLLS